MKSLNRLLLILETIFSLGIREVTYIAYYRISLKSGIRKFFFRKQLFASQEDFYHQKYRDYDLYVSLENISVGIADRNRTGEFRFYSYHWLNLGNPPNWFKNPFNGIVFSQRNNHWTSLNDFHSPVGDIKHIWEISRFQWVVNLAKGYALTGNGQYIRTLNSWLNDWAEKNPLNIGPNWKCGQETSIRVFNLLTALFILDQVYTPSSTIVDFIYKSLQRIRGNIRYAISQNNNHGTSEAAALYIGGCWLEIVGIKNKETVRFQSLGRKLLKNRLSKLVSKDGGFSQYSINYHRVVLDTISLVQFWNKELDCTQLDGLFFEKAGLMIDWILQVTDEVTGRTPNFGSNDGSELLNIQYSDYNDFRPSIQLASVLFRGYKVFNYGPCDEPLSWLKSNGPDIETRRYNRENKVMSSGYLVIISNISWCFLRIPYFKFRPTQNDVFHFDLWWQGKNIVPDSGTYSYNPAIKGPMFDFCSAFAHNTVSFDNKDQMPRVSRFLLSKWIRPTYVGMIKSDDISDAIWEGTYNDSRKNKHKRRITNRGNTWLIEDEISGEFNTAKIGFNLNCNYKDIYIKDDIVDTNWGKIEVSNHSGIEIVTTWKSEYYTDKARISRLVIKAEKRKKVITKFVLNQ